MMDSKGSSDGRSSIGKRSSQARTSIMVKRASLGARTAQIGAHNRRRSQMSTKKKNELWSGCVSASFETAKVRKRFCRIERTQIDLYKANDGECGILGRFMPCGLAFQFGPLPHLHSNTSRLSQSPLVRKLIGTRSQANRLFKQSIFGAPRVYSQHFVDVT
jgi:hypothetical protein